MQDIAIMIYPVIIKGQENVTLNLTGFWFMKSVTRYWYLCFIVLGRIQNYLRNSMEKYGANMTEQVLNQFHSEAQKAIDDLRAEAAGLPEMSLDEINAEIRASRAERKVIIEKNK